ncbi:MAG: hypothetical protein MUF54_00145 [Polyangiaceae bacterium]|nr:hypothetical protein [Polyangiaceae bacterium]
MRFTAPDTQDQTNQSAEASGASVDWLRLATEAFTGSTSYFDSAIRKGLIDDLRQFQGQHPQGSKYHSDAYRSRSKFFRPKTRAAVRKNEAIAAEAFFSTADVLSVKPHDDDDPAQQASAEINKELLQYRLTKTLPWFLILVGAYQDAQVQGVVCSYQDWLYNPAKGIDRPDVQLRPLENIRFDPNASWDDLVGTSPYLIDMIPMYVKDVRARMQPDDKTGKPRWNDMPDTALLKASTNPSDVVRLQREQSNVDPANARTAISAFTVVWIHRNIVEVDGEDWVYHTLGTQALLDEPRRLRDVYFHGKRPYVIGFSVVETHKAYKPGNVRLGAQVQAELNENANQRIDNVRFAMNKRYFARRNAQVDLRSPLAPAQRAVERDPHGRHREGRQGRRHPRRDALCLRGAGPSVAGFRRLDGLLLAGQRAEQPQAQRDGRGHEHPDQRREPDHRLPAPRVRRDVGRARPATARAPRAALRNRRRHHGPCREEG